MIIEGPYVEQLLPLEILTLTCLQAPFEHHNNSTRSQKQAGSNFKKIANAQSNYSMATRSLGHTLAVLRMHRGATSKCVCLKQLRRESTDMF